MNLSADEFLSLSTQLSDRDVRVVELEKQLEETRRLLLVKEGEVVALTQRLAEAEQIQQATEIVCTPEPTLLCTFQREM